MSEATTEPPPEADADAADPDWVESDWGEYERESEAGPVLILVDMAWDGVEGRPPHLIQAVSTYEPAEAGLPSAEDFARLTDEDGRLAELAVESGKLHFVGAILHNGRRTRYFYGEEPGSGSILTRVPEVEISRRPDPEWSVYEGRLLPDGQEYRVLDNNRLIAELEEDGVDVSAPLPLEHYFLFKTLEAAEEAATALDERGFRTVDFQEVDGDFPERLAVTREDSVEAPGIHEMTLELQEYAEELDGIYDGWEMAEE